MLARSRIRTRIPACASSIAHANPPGPAPIMLTVWVIGETHVYENKINGETCDIQNERRWWSLPTAANSSVYKCPQKRTTNSPYYRSEAVMVKKQAFEPFFAHRWTLNGRRQFRGSLRCTKKENSIASVRRNYVCGRNRNRTVAAPPSSTHRPCNSRWSVCNSWSVVGSDRKSRG